VKREATADAIGTHERASATPVRDAASHAPVGAAPSLPERLDLRFMQEWFARIVTTPESEPAPVDEGSALALATPSATLTSLERLEIYRRSYHARLVECLADDYPALQHHLGEEAFDALCRRYIARFPSTGPSLNDFGRHMAAFCRGEALPEPGFAADLASLEWAIVLAIHAPTARVITEADLAGIAHDSWPGACLIANPSLRFMRLEYPANAYFQAFRTGGNPVLPAANATNVVVYRTGTSIWRMELAPAALVLFEALAGGARLQQAIERAAPLLDRAEDIQQVAGWFRSGVASGLFVGVAAD